MNSFFLYSKKFFGILFGNGKIKRKATRELEEKRFKLGITYNVFDGVQLLEASVKNMRNVADYINIVYQNVSNFGEKANKEDELIIKKLKEDGLVNNVIYYTPNLSVKASKNEVKKRDIGLKDCIKNGCTYFLNMDSDEFYRIDEVKEAIKYMLERKIDTTYCAQYFYIKKPTYRSKWPKVLDFVPFISKISKNSKIKRSQKTFCLVDPTRMIVNKNNNAWFFSPCVICMHHMQYVRNDLDVKFRNSSCNNKKKKYLDEANKCIKKIVSYKFPDPFSLDNDYFYDIIEVENEFNIVSDVE